MWPKWTGLWGLVSAVVTRIWNQFSPVFYRFLVLHNHITHPEIRTTARLKPSAAPSFPISLFTVVVNVSERRDLTCSNHDYTANLTPPEEQSNWFLCRLCSQMINLCIKHKSVSISVHYCRKKAFKRSRKYEMVVSSSSRENLRVQNFTAAC